MGDGAGANAVPGSLTDRDTVADLQDQIDVLSAFTGGIVFEFDREGRYLRVSTGDKRLLARPIDQMVGRTLREVLGAEMGERFHDAIRAVYDSGISTSFEYALDVQVGRRTFSCEVRAHDPRGGGARTVTAVVRDVTDAKILEAKLVQAERLAALGLLAASVGHEVRQPLAYLRSSLDVLHREFAVGASESASASLANIRGGVERIAEIAASLDLLAASRPRAPKAIDVRRPLQAALDLCASELSRLGPVERHLPDLQLVMGSEGELCQVFTNLLLNAADAHVSRGGNAPVVTVEGAASDGMVRISVTDTGSGIPAEALAHVFEPFFTTKEQGRGTGLGLFISRNLVEARGGTIEIRSTPGVGTTVVVALPVVATEEPSAPGSGTSAVVAKRRLNVLVIDDEPRFLASLSLALDGIHHVETQSIASRALALLEADPTRYDAVLCDLSMPVVDGVTLYERMESLGVADRFILMTGGAFTPRTSEFLQRSACPTITKPFDIEALLDLLARVVPPQPSLQGGRSRGHEQS